MDGLKPDYRVALLAEIASRKDDLARHAVTSIAFGGGTPGEQPASDIAAVIQAIRDSAPLLPAAEIALEVNPGTTLESQLRELAAAGVNRVSIGAQSFDPVELQFLDRIHSVEAIRATVTAARRAEVRSVNADLIYGLPGQSLPRWGENVARAVELDVDHISAYALTVEDGTPLSRRVARGEVSVPPDDTLADMYDLTTAVLAAAGYEQYEISNWARPGHQSRHNRTYWEFGEYLGVGAGAHGFFEDERYENIAHPREYIAGAALDPPAVIANAYRPETADSMVDFLGLRLRLLEGFPTAEFRRWFGVDIDAVLGEPLARVLQAGVLEYKDARLSLSPSGRLLHGEVVAQCLTYLQAHPDVLSGIVMAARC
jgi:oxygen-independent coproporphyrinogen-3 oxidase